MMPGARDAAPDTRYPARMAVIRLPAPAATEALGARLGPLLRAGDAVLLRGGLGAGKTTLARGLIAAFTQTPDLDAPSPTYTLVQTYDGGPWPLAHLDLYRIEDPAELDELGLDEALALGVCVIEWPERLGSLLPASRIDIALETGPDEGRTARLKAVGPVSQRFEESFG